MSEPREDPVGVGGACDMANKLTDWIRHIVDPAEQEKFYAKYRDDFRAGRPLIEIAEELRAFGITDDHSIGYISALPTGIQDELSATIRSILERDEMWLFRFDFEEADEFSVRLQENTDKRTATFVLIGPH